MNAFILMLPFFAVRLALLPILSRGAARREAGLVTRGVYRLSRNPMNAAYALYYLGVSALAKSPVLLSLAVVNSLAAHWVILSEERWCAEAFGEAWEAYSSKVRRYI